MSKSLKRNADAMAQGFIVDRGTQAINATNFQEISSSSIKVIHKEKLSHDNSTRINNQSKLLRDNPEYHRHIEVLSKNPDSYDSNLYMYRAHFFERGGEYYLSQVLKNNPNNALSNYQISHELFKLGKFQQALIYCDFCISASHRYDQAYSLKSKIFLRLQDLNSAFTNASCALVLNPKNSEALIVMAEINIAQKKYDEAIKFCLEALKYQSNGDEVHVCVAKCYALIYPKDISMPYVDQLFARAQNNPQLFQKVGNLYLQIKEYQKASDCYLKIYEFEPHKIQHIICAIVGLCKAHNLDQAASLLENNLDKFLIDQSENIREIIDIFLKELKVKPFSPASLGKLIEKCAQIKQVQNNNIKSSSESCDKDIVSAIKSILHTKFADFYMAQKDPNLNNVIIRHLKLAIASNNRNFELYHKLGGVCAQNIETLEEAFWCFSEAESLKPELYGDILPAIDEV
ncbi:MAG: hypothetical protein SFT91_03750 [Rickettsiaceae bacterium]|nr:hypothetical protein [Rickettsiaceae bacterium]